TPIETLQLVACVEADRVRGSIGTENPHFEVRQIPDRGIVHGCLRTRARRRPQKYADQHRQAYREYRPATEVFSRTTGRITGWGSHLFLSSPPAPSTSGKFRSGKHNSG